MIAIEWRFDILLFEFLRPITPVIVSSIVPVACFEFPWTHRHPSISNVNPGNPVRGSSCVLRLIALSGCTGEVSEIERLELRLRNGLLLLATSGQLVKHDGVEVDIRIHKVVQSTFRFRKRVPGA